MAETAGLAGCPPQDADWSDLLDGRAPREPGETAAEVKRSLGIGLGYERPGPAGAAGRK
jgi:hypothetical protein